jgi:hypothetical protein
MQGCFTSGDGERGLGTSISSYQGKKIRKIEEEREKGEKERG